jgi:hypothetical protein
MVVLAYGGGLAIWSFSEIMPGQSGLMFDPVEAIPLAAMMTIHLCAGAGIRWWQMRQEGGQQ